MPKKTDKKPPELPFDSPEFADIWELYLKHRREKGSSNYTATGLEMVFKKIFTLSVGMEDVAIKILTQSIENNWTGIFPLKQPIQNGQGYFQQIGLGGANTRANSNSKSAGAYQLLGKIKDASGHNNA